MGGNNPVTRASEQVPDGCILQVPGVRNALAGSNPAITGPFRGDQAGDIQVLQSGNFNLFGGAATPFKWLAPFAYTILDVVINLIAPPGTGPATVSVGTSGTAGKFVNAFSIGTGATTGYADWLANLTATLTGAQGDIIQVSTNGGGTATGNMYAAILLVPTAP